VTDGVVTSVSEQGMISKSGEREGENWTMPANVECDFTSRAGANCPKLVRREKILTSLHLMSNGREAANTAAGEGRC
jgi:hypothetical protein